MNKQPIRFQELVDRAQREPVPPLDADIVDQVVDRLAPVSLPVARIERSLWSVAALSITAAVVALLVANHLGVFFDDPLTDWLHPFVMVMR